MTRNRLSGDALLAADNTGAETLKDEVKIEPVVQPTPPGCLDSDIACVQCEHNIRGLPVCGECSKCGATLARSLAPDRLIFADQRWLMGIHRGLVRLEWALSLLILSPFVPFFASVALLRMGVTESLENTLLLVGGSYLLMLTGLTCWGVPGVMASDPHERRTRRAAGLTLGVWSAIALLVGLTSIMLLWELSLVASRLIALAILLSFYVFLASLSLRLLDLAARLPNPRLARICRRSVPLTLLALLVMGGLTVASDLSEERSVIVIGVIILWLVGIYHLNVLLFIARRGIKREIGEGVCYDDVAAVLAESSAAGTG